MRPLRLCTLGVFLSMFLACSFSRVTYGQGGEADVAGVVTDQSGAVLAGVQVTLTNTDTGAVAPGTYTVSARGQGFSPESITGLRLALGVHLQQNIILKTGSEQQTVLVSGAVPLIDYQDTSVGGVIEQRQIETLPISNRQYLNLSVLLPGTTQDATRTCSPAAAAIFTPTASCSTV
jgi:hypothetical protein